MDIESYLRAKERRISEGPHYREICWSCRQPDFGCYCEHIKSFDPKIKFVILIHPIEVKRRIATGRMAHLCLENSELICGQDYTMNRRINEILKDSNNHSVCLYPGAASVNLTNLTNPAKEGLFPKQKKLIIFVIDGTWATARKMIHQSQNLRQLPRACFTPPKLSNFRVRKQPHPQCYSTIEAIHHTLELIGPTQGFDLDTGAHHKLIFVFDKMVERQLEFIRLSELNPVDRSFRRIQRT